MKKKVKELAEMLIKKAENFVNNDYKWWALEELEKLEKDNISVPHISFIVDNYPSFNHIEVKVEQPNTFRVEFCVNPKVILENKKTAYVLAKMMYSWLAKGAHFENERN